MKRTAFVYTRNSKLGCDLCEGTDCIHTRYAETLEPQWQTPTAGVICLCLDV